MSKKKTIAAADETQASLATHRKLEDFTPDDRNLNQGTERGAALLEKSLQRFGAGRSILVDRDGRIIAGNKTHEAALERGLKAIEVETDGTTLVVVKRTDISLDSLEGRELALADNRVAEVNLSWDEKNLEQFAKDGVKLHDWFFDTELEKEIKPVGELKEIQVKPEPELVWCLLSIPIEKWGQYQEAVEKLQAVSQIATMKTK